MIAFCGNPLDRAGDRRSDSTLIAALRADPRTKILPLWRLQPLLAGPEDGASPSELRFVDAMSASALGDSDSAEVFLGLDGDTAYFARDVSGLAHIPEFGPLGHFREARAAAAVLPSAQVAILGQAKALLDWHARHRFCSRCGAPTGLADAGYRRICPACKTEHFPRTDPAVIMLVTTDNDCLLARNKRFADGFYSTLAGFVEPGESIEEAVAREVLEEAGVRVGRVRYFASQPWPFPASLMIGCFAESLTREIVIDGNEIVAAQWFDRATIRKLLAGESHEISLPRRDAIAFHLIKAWAEES